MKTNPNFRIFLLSCPATLMGAFFLNLLSTESALAIDVDTQSANNNNSLSSTNSQSTNLECNRANCTGNNHLAAFPQVEATQNPTEEFPNLEQNEEGHLLLDVSEEESDTAVSMFGCDCIQAVNALRQLRGIPIGVEGNRILPGPLIRPCTQTLPS